VCLDKDLEADAPKLLDKEGRRGDDKRDIDWVEGCLDWTNDNATDRDFLTSLYERQLAVNIDAETKLTIIAHGVEDSSCVSNRRLTPQNLARMVAALLKKTKIKRVSLLACYSGGNKKPMGFSQALKGTMKVPPDNSFGYKFASHAGGICGSVTGRMAESQTFADQVRSTGKYINVKHKVGLVSPRHHGQGDKVVFKPDPQSTVAQGKAPTWNYETYANG
jgi:hypothetical protein